MIVFPQNIFRFWLLSKQTIEINHIYHRFNILYSKTTFQFEKIDKIKFIQTHSKMTECKSNVEGLKTSLPHRIGFIGGGKMGLALGKGFMAAGLVAPDQVSNYTT